MQHARVPEPARLLVLAHKRITQERNQKTASLNDVMRILMQKFLIF